MGTTVLGLRTTIYKVPDLEKAKRWYAVAFGAEPYFDDGFYAGFNIGGYELGLMKDDSHSGAGPANVLTYWGVEDIAEAVRFFIDQGAELVDPAVNVGGEIQVASVKDPWGNAIGLIYNPEFKLP